MKPGQSPLASFLERLANVTAGYVVALLVQAIAYPQFGIVTNLSQDATIAAMFTIASLVRSFLLRRTFEFITRRNQVSKASEHART